MNKYLVILAAPSLHLPNDPQNYIEPYVLNFDSDKGEVYISKYVDEILMRKFALDYSVALSDVRILAAAKIK